MPVLMPVSLRTLFDRAVGGAKLQNVQMADSGIFEPHTSEKTFAASCRCGEDMLSRVLSTC